MRRAILYCAVLCALIALLLFCKKPKAPIGVSFPEPPVEIATNGIAEQTVFLVKVKLEYD